MKKKYISLFLVVVMLLTLAVGCGSKEAPAPKAAEPEKKAEEPEKKAEEPAKEEGFKFDHKIELVVGFGTGSGTDTTTRAIAPILEKILGVDVIVTNVEGSGGIKGMEYAKKQPADGYTYMIGTQSLLLNDLQDLTDISMTEDFVGVTRLVHSCVCVATRADSQFNTWEEVVDYAKDHPGELKIGAQTPKGIDALSSRVIFKSFGVDIPFVAFNSGAETQSAVLGGHCEFINADPSEVGELIDAGEMKCLLVANDSRLSVLPDVPCTGDFGHPEANLGAWRGFFARKGCPEEALKAMEAAFAEAYKSEEFQGWLKNNGLDQRNGYADMAGFTQIVNDEMNTLAQIFEEYGLYDK